MYNVLSKKEENGIHNRHPLFSTSPHMHVRNVDIRKGINDFSNMPYFETYAQHGCPN
jgi:hypothetical protein